MRNAINYAVFIALFLTITDTEVRAQEISGLIEKDVSVYGFNLHYAEAGQGSPIVLLHGLWGGRNEWQHTIGPLAESHRVIALDLIGFHGSDKPEATYHNALLSQFLVGFIEALKLEQVTLMGHAMGGNTATYTAVHYPQHVAQLILVDGAGYRNPNRDPTAQPSAGMMRMRRIVTGSTVATTRNFLKRRVKDQSLVTDAWAEEAFHMWLNSARAISDMLGEGGDVTEEEMKTITVPTLIVWGREDGAFPLKNADRLEADIAGSVKVVFDNTGHLPQIEQPDAFNRVVLDFLAK
ncbi:MAG: alpha/beta fold hydrolase [Candidatus Latescibacteria bacterium]|nr:alpha/beta fold hydrolase [Candidatus Latescibacterota bacterium]